MQKASLQEGRRCIHFTFCFQHNLIKRHVNSRSCEVKTNLTADVSYMASYFCSSDHQETWSHLVSGSLMGGEKNERPENMICCGPWNSESKRLSRRIHADLTPLQNLHAHAHCRLDTIADLTLDAMSNAHGQCNSVPRCTGHWSYDEGQDVPKDLGRLFPKQANALLVSALYSG